MLLIAKGEDRKSKKFYLVEPFCFLFLFFRLVLIRKNRDKVSLGIIIKAPEGLVLAAESRVTLTTGKVSVNFDNATKVFSFKKYYSHIGVVTYGQAAIGFRTAQSFIPEFETSLKDNSLTVNQFATRLSEFFMNQWSTVMLPDYSGPNMTMNVAGFDNNEPYGKIYSFDIPRAPIPVEQSPPVGGQHQFGIVWGGQREIVDRLILGYDNKIFSIFAEAGVDAGKITEIQGRMQALNLPMPIQFMPLQDCVNLAILFIRTTIEAQSLTVGLRGCGGDIDIAIITRDNALEFIQKKNIKGEQQNN